MWQDHAACKGQTDLFFDPDRYRDARAICLTCPVYLDCAEYRETYYLQIGGGIWAGLSMEPSARTKRRRRKDRLRVVA
jgi:hypothetical protein